jgi:calcineurin-like phosphoesterase family protein
MSVFYTADLHLGHSLVAAIRGFESAEAHDRELVERWNNRIQHDDTVWILGDLSLKKVERFADTLESLRGRKRVVLGNHDTAHPMHRGWANQHMELAALSTVDLVVTEATVRIHGTQVALSHFPAVGDHTDADRFIPWRPFSRKFVVHGHTHSESAFTRDATGLAIDTQLHVGLDAWGLLPVREKVIQDSVAYALEGLRGA